MYTRSPQRASKAIALVQACAASDALIMAHRRAGADAATLIDIQRDYLAAVRSDDFEVIDELRRELKAELAVARISSARAAALRVAQALALITKLCRDLDLVVLLARVHRTPRRAAPAPPVLDALTAAIRTAAPPTALLPRIIAGAVAA